MPEQVETHTEDSQTVTATDPPSRKKVVKKALLWLLVALLLAIIAVLVWLLLGCRDHEVRLQNEKKQLQSKVDDLTKRLGEATTQPAQATCSPKVTDALKETIRAAITSRNYAALEAHITNPAAYVLAASEFGGPQTPAQVVESLSYLDSATTPWDFNLSAATLASYDAGFYTDYFDSNTYVGKSANNMVVSFDFNECGKIKSIFVSADAGLLL